ncbi:MAG: DUF2953 domain-containing protein [Bacillota bacterium]
MIELLLFLAVFCLFFFLPVQFRIFYQKIAWDDDLLLEISFLKGRLKRSRSISLLQLTPRRIKQRQKSSGRWFFIRRSKVKEVESSYLDNSRGMREFLHRYHHYGLGIALLTYFLPAKYRHWLLVVEDLEKRGRFTKFIWITKFGTGNPVSTATLYGALWGFKSSAIAFLRRNFDFKSQPEIQIIPDFQNPRFDLKFDCIFRIKLGYIIIAAFIARFRHRFLKGGIGVGKPSN